MAGKRYKHPSTLQDRRRSRVTPPLELIAPGADRLGDDLAEVPKPPVGLGARARGYWEILHRGPMAAAIIRADGFAVHRYITAVDSWLVTLEDLRKLRRELVPSGRARAAPARSLASQLEELQELRARDLIDDDQLDVTTKRVLDAWAESAGQAPPVVTYYTLTWRLRQALRQVESELRWQEQAFGLNPLARMRLNIEAADAISGIEELNRMLDGGPSAAAEPEWVNE